MNSIIVLLVALFAVIVTAIMFFKLIESSDFLKRATGFMAPRDYKNYIKRKEGALKDHRIILNSLNSLKGNGFFGETSNEEAGEKIEYSLGKDGRLQERRERVNIKKAKVKNEI